MGYRNSAINHFHIDHSCVGILAFQRTASHNSRVTRQVNSQSIVMNDGPNTRETLLLRMRNHTDKDAWKQFVDVYAPVIQTYACRKGLH
jgi:hypothetical protein